MRIILAALADAGLQVDIQRVPVWDGVEDKSGIRGSLAAMRFALRYLLAIVQLWFRYQSAPPHDVVLIGYLGQFDVLAFRPLAYLFRKPVVWDAFLSLYDTVVNDRAMTPERSLAARLLRRLEGLSCRAADLVVLDTGAHAERFARMFALDAHRLAHVPVGAEPEAFPALPPKPLGGDAPLTILFYGQFIPLHGVETIVEAARMSAERNWRWRLIGSGQEAPKIRASLDARPAATVDWIEWTPYEQLSEEIGAAHICLGIFGKSEKAASVVPNKAYQIIASNRPLITRDSPAIRELAPKPTAGLALVPPSDPGALVEAVSGMEAWLRSTPPIEDLHAEVRRKFAVAEIGRRWKELLSNAVR